MSLWTGRQYHVHLAVGGAVYLVCHLQGFPPLVAVEASLMLGVVHEWMDGCFSHRSPDFPWGGLLDTLAFMPLPLAGWMLS